MSNNTPKTDDAIDALVDAEFVTEFEEGSNSAKRLSPSDLKILNDLENERAARKNPGRIFRRVIG